VYNELRDKSKEKVFKDSPCKTEARPIVSILQILQTISIFESDLTPEILFVEYFNRNLPLSSIFCAVAFRAKVKIMFYRPAWEPCLFIHAGRHRGKDSPECHQNWDHGENCDKDCEVEATTELKRYEPWDGYQEEEEESVGPRIISCTISW
jgi:hypothetical protein